jgi:hypothetical protein
MTSPHRVSRRLILQAGAATTALGAPGLLLMYGGVAALSLYTLAQYRVVGRH